MRVLNPFTKIKTENDIESITIYQNHNPSRRLLMEEMTDDQ